MFFSENNKFSHNTRHIVCRRKDKAFTLLEVTVALAILALISSSVLVVINRCVASSANSTLRMRAFEVTRENMEKLLASDSVRENIDYGYSLRYPDIAWQTVVETFYEPITARMWIRGVCSAEYKDAEGQQESVELTHWLTDLSKEQLLQMVNKEDAEQWESQLIETLEEAAEYAGVEVETIEKWIDDGMLTAEDGSFVRHNLDIFKLNDGNPSEEDKKLQIQSQLDLQYLSTKQNMPEGENAGEVQDWQNEIDPKTGLTYGEMENMEFSEIWEILQNKQK
jgi:prepilin-type N-terminal cleavage/methylation domain-containing protein